LKDSCHCFEVAYCCYKVPYGSCEVATLLSVGAKLMTTDVKIPNDVVKLTKLGYHSYEVAMFL
jgi:hypothetical protein